MQESRCIVTAVQQYLQLRQTHWSFGQVRLLLICKQHHGANHRLYCFPNLRVDPLLVLFKTFFFLKNDHLYWVAKIQDVRYFLRLII